MNRLLHLHFTIGPTNAGKTTAMQVLKRPEFGGCGTVEVGQLMRAKYLDPQSPFYDPNYFKGSAAPDHTETEAWQMMKDGILHHIKQDRLHVFIDGQPRRMSQLDKLVAEYVDANTTEVVVGDGVDRITFRVHFLHIYSPEAFRERRAKARDTDPAKLALSMQRMQGDVLVLYDILSKMNVLGLTKSMTTIDTSKFNTDAVEASYITALQTYLKTTRSD